MVIINNVEMTDDGLVSIRIPDDDHKTLKRIRAFLSFQGKKATLLTALREALDLYEITQKDYRKIIELLKERNLLEL